MPNGTCNESDDTHRGVCTQHNNSSVSELTTTPKRARAASRLANRFGTNVEDHHKESKSESESERKQSGERVADNGDAADDSLPG